MEELEAPWEGPSLVRVGHTVIRSPPWLSAKASGPWQGSAWALDTPLFKQPCVLGGGPIKRWLGTLSHLVPQDPVTASVQ